MSRQRQHPIDSLIATAEETARIMWRTYQDILANPVDSPEWKAKAQETYKRCLACDERVESLRASRAKRPARTKGNDARISETYAGGRNSFRESRTRES